MLDMRHALLLAAALTLTQAGALTIRSSTSGAVTLPGTQVAVSTGAHASAKPAPMQLAPMQPAPMQPAPMQPAKPRWMSEAQAEAAAFVKAGGQINLLDKAGQVIGALDASGNWTVSGSSMPSAVAAVQIVSGTSVTTYPVSGDLTQWQSVRVTVTGPNGQPQQLPLAAAVKRASAEIKVKAQKPEKPEKAEKPKQEKGPKGGPAGQPMPGGKR